MNLNPYGKIAHDEWLHSIKIRDNIQLHDFIVMPNHFHAILEITFKKPPQSNQLPGQFISPSHSLGSIIRGYKIATTKKIRELLKEYLEQGEEGGLDELGKEGESAGLGKEGKLGELGELQFAATMKRIWQRNYYEHIISTEKAYRNISNYIRNNPKRWEEDKFNK